MRKDITIQAAPRTERGKNVARRMRVNGSIPAVVYGAFQESIPIAVSPKEISQILHSKTGHNTIFNLSVNGKETTPVMVVDWQYDPVKSNLLHVDLKRIDLSKRIRVSIPVVTEGDAKGVKIQGGLLEVVIREIDVECLPDEIAEHFTVNVAELLIGQSIRAGEIPLPGSMKLLSPAEAVIVHVVGMKAEEEAAPAVEAEPAAAEPEVIKKGKKEEEEEADKKKKK
ncbi:MAG: 50S ribosomal protein L25 [Bryobacteraceae bacterium]